MTGRFGLPPQGREESPAHLHPVRFVPVSLDGIEAYCTECPGWRPVLEPDHTAAELMAFAVQHSGMPISGRELAARVSEWIAGGGQ